MSALRGSTLARHGSFFLVVAILLLVLTSFVFDPFTNYNITEAFETIAGAVLE